VNVVIPEPIIVVTPQPIPTPTQFAGYQTPDPITYDVYGKQTQGADTNRYNGYYNEFGKWIPGVVKAESQFLIMPDLVIGEAWGGGGKGIHSFGDYGTVDNIVIPFCSEIGNYVWAKREGHEWEGPFRVIDCAARYDIYNVVVNRHEVAEILFKTAVKWNMIELGTPNGEGLYSYGWNMRRIENVMISKINPDCLGDLQPVKLDEWFRDRVQYFETKDEGMQWEDDNPSGTLTKNINGIPQWRINGEWITFPRNSMECE
jgi:hypothetical protein